ncbi:MAG: pyridoxamine 5'-phosphate oxidase family protein [Dermatophilaceae bacterium]
MFRDDDLELLARPLHALLTVAPRTGRWPAPRPVWFELTDAGELQMFSEPGAPKLDRLREQPRASVVVAASPGDADHWMAVEGTVTLHDDGGSDLAARLAERYGRADDPATQELVEQWRADGVVRIVLHPERVDRFPT